MCEGREGGREMLLECEKGLRGVCGLGRAASLSQVCQCPCGLRLMGPGFRWVVTQPKKSYLLSHPGLS